MRRRPPLQRAPVVPALQAELAAQRHDRDGHDARQPSQYWNETVVVDFLQLRQCGNFRHHLVVMNTRTRFRNCELSCCPAQKPPQWQRMRSNASSCWPGSESLVCCSLAAVPTVTSRCVQFDGGPHFNCELFRGVLRTNHLDASTGPPRQEQSQAPRLAERANLVLVESLRRALTLLSESKQRDYKWIDHASSSSSCARACCAGRGGGGNRVDDYGRGFNRVSVLAGAPAQRCTRRLQLT